ncbi:MAG TPA: class I SAM-dependent methyltransferase [Polyangia bacterium]|nr:class I SAM-dependent methyltransferase [Polyangia bacterium]
MDPSGSLIDVLCCPRCAGTLVEAEGGHRCGQCGTGFPVFGRVPCLLDDPTLWRTLWLRRLDDYGQGIELRVATLRQEAEATDMLPRTRQRLGRIADAFVQQLETVTALFDPLDADPDPMATAVIPSRPEPGAQAAILECYEHLFRDWAWGGRECELALGLVAPLLPAGLDRVAIYGAGTGRLAADVHQASGAARTLAFDVNPLPFLVTDRLLAGETVTLPEFPVDPTSDDAVVIPRALARPFAVRDGFQLVFADALRPPVPTGSLDAVVTSWFIDIARADLRETAAAINRVLRPGGLWVNLGPLRFQQVLSRAYTIEEVLEIVAAGAFELGSHDRHDLPYFDSPVSGSRRTDTVFRFLARKTGEAPAVEVPDPLPPWVANPMMPIPITPALIALGRTSMFTTGVLGMIDGSRSIIDVARELGRAWNVDPGRLQDELRAFLARIPG